ncbi:MAG: hypothetical protein ABIP33_03120 [Pseudolysinimonas sp.]
MSDQAVNAAPKPVYRHLTGCATCATQTRSSAYRWLGLNNPIPATHGANWLGEDLRRTLEDLEPGQEIELDYTGAVENAPRIALYRTLDDIVTASGPLGWIRVPGHTTWALPASTHPDRDTWLTFMLLNFLKGQRGAEHVVLVRPVHPK